MTRQPGCGSCHVDMPAKIQARQKHMREASLFESRLREHLQEPASRLLPRSLEGIPATIRASIQCLLVRGSTSAIYQVVPRDHPTWHLRTTAPGPHEPPTQSAETIPLATAVRGSTRSRNRAISGVNVVLTDQELPRVNIEAPKPLFFRQFFTPGSLGPTTTHGEWRVP
jgi:hypothetical protein